jgi:hypothetical protein
MAPTRAKAICGESSNHSPETALVTLIRPISTSRMEIHQADGASVINDARGTQAPFCSDDHVSRLRDPALRGAAARRDPAADAEIAM